TAALTERDIQADGTTVTVPVQPSVMNAAGLNTAAGRARFRFEINERDEAVSAVRLDEFGQDQAHSFYKTRPARIAVGGQSCTARTRDGHKLEIAIPAYGKDLFQAQALLRRSHPRGAPFAGIVVTARFANTAEQENVRCASAKRMPQADPWSPAWGEAGGSIVGAITVSRLFHGAPNGRKAIAEALGIELPTGEDARKKTVEQLGLVWVSRVAVDAPYRHSEIGTQLLRTLRTSIGATLPWEPGRVEVLQPHSSRTS
ncbi:hypothetical protein, partial [Mycobacterium marinum]|uniref:hypothetical protein n=1 Tax=Mycobacterium marinum TaxID=1781 RepID=UPI00356B0F44